ncbi:hypothetical protein ColTof4_06425 [Colletotrichum tofieldiae]|nr:hypothetical protein ColTof3_01620 [Colletotrichum tofieldiae]GKT74002.1 hypothetical protein ColTof4_06425 [Colletotrichum tofieldiae]
MTGSDKQNQSEIAAVDDEQVGSDPVEGGESQNKPLSQPRNEETNSHEAGTCIEDVASEKELHKLGVDVDDPDLGLDNGQETPAYE